MDRPTSTATLLIVAIILALIPVSTPAQRLYNKERDEQAQAALPLAQALKTGELFDRQLKNLSSLAKKDFETEFLVTRFQIDAFTLNMLTWDDAHTQVCDVERINIAPGLLPSATDVQTAADAAKKSIKNAQDALDAFKESVKQNEDKPDNKDDDEDSSILATLFNNLGDLQTLTDFAEQVKGKAPNLVTTKTVESLKEIQEIAETLQTVYVAYTEKVKKFNELNDQLAEMRILLKKVAIQSLQVDEEHWKNIASIRARREIERANVLGLIKEYKGIVRRLKLVDFNDSTKKFCTAVGNATNAEEPLDVRPFHLITEDMAEMVARAESLETNNRHFETEAQKAISMISTASSEVQRREISKPAFDAFEEAIKNIGAHDAIRMCDPIENDSKKSDCMTKERADLDNALKVSNAETVKALTAILIRARKNRIEIRNMSGDIPQALFILATLIARGSTPNRLADVRFAQELHAYSIRKSAVRARAYELTVSTGAQRLALFHKGGIKPTDIAELVFAASNVAITPAILAR